MLGINPLTADLLLLRFTDLEPGVWVEQTGANSAVGRYVATSTLPLTRLRPSSPFSRSGWTRRQGRFPAVSNRWSPYRGPWSLWPYAREVGLRLAGSSGLATAGHKSGAGRVCRSGRGNDRGTRRPDRSQTVSRCGGGDRLSRQSNTLEPPRGEDQPADSGFGAPSRARHGPARRPCGRPGRRSHGVSEPDQMKCCILVA